MSLPSGEVRGLKKYRNTVGRFLAGCRCKLARQTGFGRYSSLSTVCSCSSSYTNSSCSYTSQLPIICSHPLTSPQLTLIALSSTREIFPLRLEMQVLAAMVPTGCIQVVTPSQSPPSHLFPSHHNSLSSASDQGNRNMSHLKYINLDTISWNVRPIPGQSIYSKLLTLPYHTNPHHPEYQHQKLSASRQKLQRIQQRDHPKHQLHKVWHQTRQSGLALA